MLSDVRRNNDYHQFSNPASPDGKENQQQHAPRQPAIRHNSSSATRVIEHTKTVTAQATTNAIKGAEGIHDTIINSYRRQLQNSSNLDSMYEALKIRLAEVQQRKNMMEDSIRYLQQDYDK